jgi:cytochrome c
MTMKTLTTAIALSALVFAGSAVASEDLVKKAGCTACHDMNAKKVGPTWKEIAAKGVKEADVVAAIEKGAKGKYGKIPMPPQPKAKDDAAAIAKWLVSVK